MLTTAKVEISRTGRTPLARSASTAMRFMSNTLVKEMSRQCAAKAICNGYNVLVTIPAGQLSQEFRRSSIPLLESGAIIRPKNYAGSINSRDGALSVIIQHEMVDLLIKKHIAIAKETSEERFGKFSTHLLRSFLAIAPKDAAGEVTVEIDNINSISAIKSVFSYRNAVGDRKTKCFSIDRDLLTLLRRIVAPFNRKEAQLTVRFSTSMNSGRIILSLNGMEIQRGVQTEIASITTSGKNCGAKYGGQRVLPKITVKA